MGERIVAVAGREFRTGDLGVDGDGVVVGEETDEAEDLADGLARGMAGEDEVGDDDRAGVDEGVARPAVLGLELDDGVEGRAGGLAADVGPQAFAEPPEREGEEKGLGDALDREGLGRVPRRVDGAVEGRDREAEALRIDVGELRDVVGDRAGAEARGERGVDLLHDLLEVG